MTPDPRIEAVAQAIYQEGGDPGNSLHSWRCQYPDRYGPCCCVSDTASIALSAADDADRAAGYRGTEGARMFPRPGGIRVTAPAPSGPPVDARRERVEAENVLAAAIIHERKMRTPVTTAAGSAETMLWALKQDGWTLDRISEVQP